MIIYNDLADNKVTHNLYIYCHSGNRSGLIKVLNAVPVV
jgi:hypothetical protein